MALLIQHRAVEAVRHRVAVTPPVGWLPRNDDQEIRSLNSEPDIKTERCREAS